MSLLDYLLIGLAIIIPGGIPIYLYWRWRTKKFNEAEEQLKKSINNFTDALVEAARAQRGLGMDVPIEGEFRELPEGSQQR